MTSWLRLNAIPEAVLPLAYITASIAVKLRAVWAADKCRSLPGRVEYVGSVTRLAVYPVKSMGGITSNEAECTRTGLRLVDSDVYDRRYLLTVGDDYRFVTARQCPTMLLIKTSIDNGQLCFDAPGMERLTLPYVQPTINERDCVVTKVWGQEVSGWDCGAKAADWFTRFLAKRDGQQREERYRLLFNAGTGMRPIKRKINLHINDIAPENKLVYHDDGPFLLTAESSLTELRQRLGDVNTESVTTMETFRPSIVIDGDTVPFDEDNWNEVFIGDAKFTQFMPCARCMLTTIDPAKGELRNDGEPLTTLKSYRIIQPGSASPAFGVYLVCDRPAVIRLNDAVYILRRRADWS